MKDKLIKILLANTKEEVAVSVKDFLDGVGSKKLSLSRGKVKRVTKVRKANDEYVYDIGMKNSNQPWFFANNILIHNSVYFSAYNMLKDDIDAGKVPWDTDSVIKLYDQIADETNKSFPAFMGASFHCPKKRAEVIAAGREIVAEAGLFITKKRYAVLVVDNEGERKDVDGKPGKIKALGLDLKRSDTPVFMQKFLSELLTMVLLKHPEHDVLDAITKFRREFKDRPGYEKGSPKRANNIQAYQRKEASLGRANMPGHVRASINWNTLKRMNGDKHSQEIVDGMKVIVCKVKANPLGYTSVAFPTDELRMPNWFKELPFDDNAMESTIIDNKLDNLIGVLNYDLQSTLLNNTFSSLFDFGD